MKQNAVALWPSAPLHRMRGTDENFCKKHFNPHAAEAVIVWEGRDIPRDMTF